MSEQPGLFPDPRPDREPAAPPEIHRSAFLSDDGVYRYRLTRRWSRGRGLGLWVMLNPSTADAEVDDPTIRRCMGFARAWGLDGIVVTNLYALRSTDPAGLRDVEDPVGPDNDEHLAHALHIARLDQVPVVAAWGANAVPARADEVVAMATAHDVTLRCLGVTKAGMPRHPLYLPSDTLPIPLAREARTIPRRNR